MDFLNEKFDYRFGTPVKMDVSDWKKRCENEIKGGSGSVRVSGNYSILLVKNSALPLELMDLGFGIETSMTESHVLISTIMHALIGIEWSKLAVLLDFYENDILQVFSLPTLNLIMQGAFEMLRVLREEDVTELDKMEARARSIGVSLRKEMGYNPFRNPEFYHKAYQTKWSK